MSDQNPDQIGQDFDFGFTAVTVDELDAIQETTAKLEESDAESTELQSRLNKMYNAIQPLLNNLKADPSKEYLWWPNRMEKIEAFSDFVDKIYKGE